MRTSTQVRIASLALVLLAAPACTTGERGAQPTSSASPVASSPSTTASAGGSATAVRSSGLAQRCGTPDVPSTVHRIRSTDGVTLAAASIGSGPRGVLLLPQSDGDSCGWWSFGGPWLASQGYRVLMLDLRCFGNSTCPSRPQKIRERLADVRAATAWLRAAGARSVAVVGVSMGGTVAMAAGADDQVSLAAAVDVSGELTDTVLRSSPPLSARTAVAKLRVPVLYLTAEDDLGVDHAADLRRLEQAPPATVRSTLVPDSGYHGWSLLTTDGTTPSRWALHIEAFLRAALT